jgi:cytochrome c oxidase subunit IV
MERDDLIEYSLHNHHDEATGKSIRKKIIQVTVLLTIITTVEVFLGALIKQSSDAWAYVKWSFIIMTLVKAAYIVMVFMHLGDEKKALRNIILIPYAIFILYFMFILIWEGTKISDALKIFGF